MEAPAQGRQQQQALLEQRLDVGQLELGARRGGRVEDRQACHMAALPGGLERELRVEARELSHPKAPRGARGQV